MAFVSDIAAAYRRPSAVMRRRLEGAGEERALIILIASLLLFFVAALPGLERRALAHDGGPGFAALAAGRFLGGVMIAPLAMYALAGLSQIVVGMVWGGGTWLRARMALFWSLAVVTPLVLLRGLIEGLFGPGPAYDAVGLVGGVAFAAFWMIHLRVTLERAS